MLRLSRSLLIVAVVLAAGCSNDNTKKKPVGNDASAFEGGADGNGMGGADAGPDAPAEAAPEAAPDAPVEAAPDAPIEAEAGPPVCPPGTIKDYPLDTCLACPGDGGSVDAGNLGDAGDPFLSSLLCTDMLGTQSGTYDPSTGILDLQLTYPLETTSARISGVFNSASGVQPFTVQNVPIANNHLVADIGTGAALSVSIDEIDFTDACGRVSTFVTGNQVASVICDALDAIPSDAGALWQMQCSTYNCAQASL